MAYVSDHIRQRRDAIRHRDHIAAILASGMLASRPACTVEDAVALFRSICRQFAEAASADPPPAQEPDAESPAQDA